MAASTTILLDPTACLDVLDRWSLEEAASIPAAYITAYIALVERVRLCTGEAVLVQGGGDWTGCVDVILNEFSSDQIMLSQRLINERGRFVNIGRSDGTQTMVPWNLLKFAEYHTVCLNEFVDDPEAVMALLREGVSSGRFSRCPEQCLTGMKWKKHSVFQQKAFP
ncbi:hypothetical protein CEXT_56011 [Caerostris extrusa]|uniref:Uncharacterized protein n=1 Tax=Caerostris extrusa TaxID=172846 RepID=A0AAV4M5M8_CAEEX|nr:hypothetical protein CEXT_56011 [Caerostris extrusa]